MKEAINIKKKHIQSGDQARLYSCPVALALRDIIEYRGSSVGVSVLNLGKDVVGHTEYTTSDDLQKWIAMFDVTGKGDPFTLMLDHTARTAEMLEA